MPPVNIARIAGQKSLASQEKYISSEGLHHVAGSRAIHRRFHHVEGVKKKYEDELLEAEAEHCSVNSIVTFLVQGIVQLKEGPAAGKGRGAQEKGQTLETETGTSRVSGKK